MALSFPRTLPMRRPDNYTPAVPRWSVTFPDSCTHVHVGFFSAQAWEERHALDSGLDEWAAEALAGEHKPLLVDHSSFTDEYGYHHRTATAYWLDTAAFEAWKLRADVRGWWEAPERLDGPCGWWREMITVPVERIETLYWRDYPAGLSRGLDSYQTPNSGYFGAMRDRIPLAACDPLLPTTVEAKLVLAPPRETEGRRWRVLAPHNLAMIRSATYWGNCDADQQADFMQNLKSPLERGMEYLRENPLESGCCALRYQQTRTPAQGLQPETHAQGYFLTLSHMENWAENHQSHHAIFGGALARYQKYGQANQLRTWHEVYVLPQAGQHFEYINCHAHTGLLPYFEAVEG